MSDTALVEGLQHHGMIVALHGVEHIAGKSLHEPARRRAEDIRAHAVNRIDGLKDVNDLRSAAIQLAHFDPSPKPVTVSKGDQNAAAARAAVLRQTLID
ncbi:hypothetical protein GCM10009099_06850 [Caenispirillum bisanense]